MDIKVGDVVHVRFVVQETYGGQFSGRDSEGDIRSYLMASDIVRVELRPLQVGDRVKRPLFRNSGGEIRAIDGSVAWIKHDDGTYQNAGLGELERAA